MHPRKLGDTLLVPGRILRDDVNRAAAGGAVCCHKAGAGIGRITMLQGSSSAAPAPQRAA